MLYKVIKQYARAVNTPPIAEFNDTRDAELFIQAKLSDDARLKVKATYKLLEGMDVLKEFSELQNVNIEEDTTSSSSQQRSSFQPTPFNAAPRPPGMPHNWVKDEEDKKGK